MRDLGSQSFGRSLCFQTAVGGRIAHHLTSRRIIATVESRLNGIRLCDRFKGNLLFDGERIGLRMVKDADVVAVRLLTFYWLLRFRIFASGLVLSLRLFRSRLGVTQGGLRHDFATFARVHSGAWLLAKFRGRRGNLPKTGLKS